MAGFFPKLRYCEEKIERTQTLRSVDEGLASISVIEDGRGFDVIPILS